MHSYLIILIVAITTIIIRFMPFILFKNKTPETIEYLGKMLPACSMAMLVVYCFRNVNQSSAIPSIIAGLVVIITYKLKHNTGISIILGTVVYMFLIQNLIIG